jgi:hypothetical protein
MTSLMPQEFDFLLTEFAPRSDRYFRYHTWQGKKRQRPRFQPQADEALAHPAQQLFFLLVYLKNTPSNSARPPCLTSPKARFPTWFSACWTCLTRALRAWDSRPVRM